MMNNTFEYRFSKIELEQFATFEENFQCEKEISFQTNTSFSFDKSNMIFISRIGVCASQMEKQSSRQNKFAILNFLQKQ